MTFIAWDIETCPTPIEQLTDAQRRRFEKELRREMERHPDRAEADASKLVRSVHPGLGWICCISAVRASLDGEIHDPASWVAGDAEDEALLLAEFWAAIDRMPRNAVWVTFNGKRFDAPWLLSRTVHHHLPTLRRDLLNTYPFKAKPHADLARLWPQSYSLDDLCDHLGVPTSKGTMTGADVADAVAAGRLDDVAAYCSDDVVATMGCLLTMPCVLDL